MIPGLPLGMSMSGLGGQDASLAGDVRAAAPRAAALGLRALHLDATAPGVRPRDLDRSGRRDLAGVIRRAGLGFSGLDLLIPPDHFADPGRADRAMSAARGAIDLAADLASLAPSETDGRVICLALPRAMAPDARASLADDALRRQVRLADLGWVGAESTGSESPIGACVDPARAIMGDADAVGLVGTLGPALACARLSDSDGAARIAPGTRGGRLDPTAYHAALLAVGYRGFVVLDLRGLVDQEAAAASAVAAWRKATGWTPPGT